MNIVIQLLNIYYTQELWHNKYLPLPEAIRYYNHLLNKGNLIYQTDDKGEIMGYLEFFKIDYDQFRKLAENKGFPVLEENISDGNICWISDVFIDEKHRNNSVYKNLKGSLFNAAKNCEYFAGFEQGHGGHLQIRKNIRRF